MPNWSNWSGCRSTEAKQLDMPAVTGVMLEELDARIADGFGHDLPVPFYSMPRGRFKRGAAVSAREPDLPHAALDIGLRSQAH